MSPEEAAAKLVESLHYDTARVAVAIGELAEWMHLTAKILAEEAKTQPQLLLESVTGGR